MWLRFLFQQIKDAELLLDRIERLPSSDEDTLLLQKSAVILIAGRLRWRWGASSRKGVGVRGFLLDGGALVAV